MIRTLSAAAVAALFASTVLVSSACAEDVTVKLSGKTAEASHAEIVKAAWNVCNAAYARDSLAPLVMSACARGAINAAVRDTKDAELIAYNDANLSKAIRLASR